MKAALETVAFAVCLFAAGCIFFSHLTGCAADQAKHVAAQAAYITEKLNCVEVTPVPTDEFSKKASWDFQDACIAGVEKRFGVVSVGRDGGR